MKIRKVTILACTLLCAVALAGCSTLQKGGEDSGNPAAAQEENPSGSSDGDVSDVDGNHPENADTLLDSAVLNGSVSGFQEGSFQVVPTQISEDGQSAVNAAPGAEEEMESIGVYYEEDCLFQIANIDSTTGEVELQDASTADIKKSTGVSIFGEWQESGEIHAEKVLITRYQ
ncbi:MAG: hypothetical protein KHY34_13455 [Lachnospiraceae bacterium]|nr:hypothetical protein [Lachnospiraceae bacterium]